jgi:hypothetical protein
MIKINVYPPSEGPRVSVKPEVGDEVDYKRQGQAGSLRCRIAYISGDRVTLQYVDSRNRFSVPASSRNFLAIYRDGRRLPCQTPRKADRRVAQEPNFLRLEKLPEDRRKIERRR